ncbi:MAG: Gfo/Idh/MocA family oxidoreductase [Bacteroidota bacterium]
MSNRRTFLKQLGSGSLAAGAALSFPSIWLPKKKEKLGVALVGLGYYSTDVLAPALQLAQHCELKGIVTGSPHKIPIWQEKYGIQDRNVYNYETMSEVANNEEIDVVYIVLPPALHRTYSVIAAEAGKEVWCEKPMAPTVADCQAMIDAAKANKVSLSIGYRLHHEPNTQTVMRYAKEQPFGKIQKVHAEAAYFDGRSNHWKQNKELGGGSMYDMGVYPLNAIRYATGEEPIAVRSAKHSTKRPEIYTEVDETTHFELEFASGAEASGITSFGMRLNELRVDCAEGWYELVPFQGYSGVKGRTSDGTLLNQTIPNQQTKQMDDDALRIKAGKTALVPGEEGLLDIRVVEAIYASAAKGGRVEL